MRATTSVSGPVRGSWAREPGTQVLPEPESPDHVPAPFAVRTDHVLTPAPLEFAPHVHPLHELVWMRGGTMTVHLADRVITVPEGHGLWIPAGTTHSGRTTANTVLCDALFHPERSRAGFTGPTAVAVTPILASLLDHLERTDLTEDERLRAEAVVFDVLRPDETQFVLDVPRNARIAPIVAALLADPIDDRTLREWAEIVGASERTVARAFRARTGLSFVQWRQSLRVHHAMALLAEGLTVNEVSERTGYAQPSTFIATFKRVVGATPGSFVRD